MTNRLANETSPYLLQHRDNPVDWYPWGAEAFERARQEDKPIFLSIGYSACHWCHVMAHESFEDEATAALMNEHFVCIKVDREERPDIDSIYMSAVQAITGSGGWPMSVFLLPDGRPFYGGTYYPNTPRHGMPSFSQVLSRIAQLYAENRAGVSQNASNLTEAIRHSVSLLENSDEFPGDEVFEVAFQAIANQYDHVNGGFSTQPKFPPSMTLELLLRMNARFGWNQAMAMVTHTLDRMASGGMYDQIGGGFHRYSTDARWLVPHFEKMLYDNALLLRVYVNAYLVTGNEQYRSVVEKTAAYVQREMTSSEGGFYSSQDADSQGHEGAFFVWSSAELEQALAGQQHIDAVLDHWGVTVGSNFEGKSILWIPEDAGTVAARHHLSTELLEASVQESARILFDLREKRVKPGTDTKILAAWNGLMIDSLALAGRALDRPDLVQMAVGAAEFVLLQMRIQGRLLRSYKDGQAKHTGFLEDHACVAAGLVSLYQSTFDARWFDEALALCEQMAALFWDDESGFHDTARDHEELIARPQELTDNAMPSGTSAAVEVMLRLATLAERRDWREKADRVLARLAPAIQGYPTAFSHLACQLDFRLGQPHEIALVGDPGAEDLRGLLRMIHRHYIPNSVVALARPGAGDAQHVALLTDKTMIDGKAAAYVCHDSVCRLPVTSPESLRVELGLEDGVAE